MLKKIIASFIIFALSIFVILSTFGSYKSMANPHPDTKGIYFFTELAGLIIPHLTFFLVSYFWAILFAPIATSLYGVISKNENYQEKYPFIAFIPILILWLFFFVIYVLDYGISFFYFHGGYDTLRDIDFF